MPPHIVRRRDGVYRKQWWAIPRRKWIGTVAGAGVTVSPPAATFSFQSPNHAVLEGMVAVAPSFTLTAPADAVEVRVAAVAPSFTFTSPAHVVLVSVAAVAPAFSFSSPNHQTRISATMVVPSFTVSAPADTVRVDVAAATPTYTFTAQAATATTTVTAATSTFTFSASAHQSRISASAPPGSWTVAAPPAATRTDVQTTPGVITWTATPAAAPSIGTLDTGIPGPLKTRTTGVGGYARRKPKLQRVSFLGYSNQVLGGVVVGDVETLIGRKFSGLRQNQAITTTGWTTASSEYDLGRTLTYREIHITSGLWSDVTAGTYDSSLTSMATNLMALPTKWNPRNPAILCFHHETSIDMNGMGGSNYGTAQDFINAFRHVRDLWDAMGATVYSKIGTYLGGPIEMAYVGWNRMFVGANGVGAPTAGQGYDDLDPDRGAAPAPAGTSYYEYAGSDPYNNLDAPGVLRYGTNAVTILQPIHDAAVARGKDWIIGEFGCPDGSTQADHDNKAAWVRTAHQYIQDLGVDRPGVCRAFLWTIKASSENFNVDSSSQSIAAYHEIGQDDYFA